MNKEATQRKQHINIKKQSDLLDKNENYSIDL